MGYLTMPDLGFAANVGSQFLQYCGLHAMSKENNLDIVFHKQSTQKTRWGLKIFNLLDVPMNIVEDSPEFIRVHNGKWLHTSNWIHLNLDDYVINGGPEVDPKLFQLDPDKNYFITGLFHTYHYWYPKYYQDIFDFSWKQNKEKLAKQYYESLNLPKNKEIVSIHVRLGDYADHPHFCKLDADYYQEALSKFTFEKDKYHFLVFSNDIEWCKDNLFEGSSITFVDPEGPDLSEIVNKSLNENTTRDDIVDLIVMSMCDHNIIANSTYGWTAAFKNKNPNKKIICPKNYVRHFSEFTKRLNGNYYIPNWISIDNSIE